MPSSRVTSYKADGADVRVVADEVDAVVLFWDIMELLTMSKNLKLLDSYLNSPPARG